MTPINTSPGEACVSGSMSMPIRYPFACRVRFPDGRTVDYQRWGGEEKRFVVVFRDGYAKRRGLPYEVAAFCPSYAAAWAEGRRWPALFAGGFIVVEAEIVEGGIWRS